MAFKLTESAGAKPMFNRYFALTEEAQALDQKIYDAMQPIMEQAYRDGFSPRDVSGLICGHATAAAAELSLLHATELRRQERTANCKTCKGKGTISDSVGGGWAGYDDEEQPCPMCRNIRK